LFLKMVLPSKTKTIKIPKSKLSVDVTISVSRSFGVNFEWYGLRPQHGSFYTFHLPFVVLSVDLFDNKKMEAFVQSIEQQAAMIGIAEFGQLQDRLDEKYANEKKSK